MDLYFAAFHLQLTVACLLTAVQYEWLERKVFSLSHIQVYSDIFTANKISCIYNIHEPIPNISIQDTVIDLNPQHLPKSRL